MATDAVAATDTPSQSYRLARNPKYEGQRSYTFEETLAMFDFWDVVDIFNPLQHIPLIGSFYRDLTGDEIGSFATVAGSALYGGPIGAVFGLANMVVKESTGKDTGQLAMAAFLPEDGGPSSLTGPPAENLAEAEIAAPLGADLLAGGGNASPASATALATAPVTVFTGVTTPGGTRAPTPAPTPALGMANTRYAAPLGGLLLASDAAHLMTGADAAATARTQALGRADAVPTLSSAQSAALAAFVAQHTGGGASRADGPQRLAALPGGTSGAEAVTRAAVAPPAATDPGQQGQDMPQDETPTMNQGQDQSASRDPHRDGQSDAAPHRPPSAATPAVPADIQRGRDALRERMAAAQVAEAALSQGPNQGLGAAAGAAGAASVASRPRGMTLADYRDRPVTPAVDADHAGARSTRPAARSAINAGDARAFASLLPDQATMARVLDQGGTVVNAIAEEARHTTEGVDQMLSPAPLSGGYPRPEAFRAMPVAGTDPVPAPAASSASETAPVVSQPWFSDRVMDAMRRYDALRTAADPAS